MFMLFLVSTYPTECALGTFWLFLTTLPSNLYRPFRNKQDVCMVNWQGGSICTNYDYFS